MSLAQALLDRIDWSAVPAAFQPASAVSVDECASAFIGYLRQRQTPSTAYTAEFAAQLRAAATEAQLAAARERLEKAFATPLIGGAHSNPFAQLGFTTLLLAADNAFAERLAAHVVASRDRWPQGPWGTTRGICDLIRPLFPLAEIEHRHLLPLFGWLDAQLWKEWEWARTWGESMLGNSGHNWWLHTFMGFWEAGLLFPEIQGYARFRSFAPAYFEHEMSLLMASDGFTRERSGYHWGTVNHWLEIDYLAEANRIAFSPAYRERLRRVGETLWQTVTPNGYVPCFGDCGARHQSPGGMPATLRGAAAWLHLPEAKAIADALAPDWQPPYRDLLPVGGRDLLPAYRRLPARLPAPDTALPDAGFYFMRQNWTPQADFLAITAGELGTIVSSHAHTDLFGIELYSHGCPILIDNCSGPYGTEASRMWRVGSSAHNVATVDGEDHLPMQNEWRWDRIVTPTVEAWRTSDRYVYFSGTHEAYRRLPQPISAARRKLFYLRGGYWILIDRFTPETDADHTYTQHFHLAAPAVLGADGRVHTKGAGGNLLMIPVGPVETVIEPCPQPLDGYDNPEHLTYTRRGNRQLFVTVLVPFAGTVPDVAVRELPITADGRTLDHWEATGLEIVIDGQADTYLDLHMQWNLPWQLGQYTGDGRLFHSRA